MDTATKHKMLNNFGKLLMDLGKLVFSMFVLGFILKFDKGHLPVVLTGFTISVAFMYVGAWLNAKFGG